MLCLNHLTDPFLPFYLLVFDQLVICAFCVLGNFELCIKIWQDVMMPGLWEDCLFSCQKIEAGIDQLSPTRNRRGSVTSHQSSWEFSLCVFSLSPRQPLFQVSPERIFPFMDISLYLNRHFWCFKWDLSTSSPVGDSVSGGLGCLHLEGARHYGWA